MHKALITGLLIVLQLHCGCLSAQQYGFRNFSIREGLPQSEIFALIQDSRGSIWAGTNGGGLSRFNGNSFDIFTTEEGLPHNQINSLYEDSKGNLWIGTVNAVSRYNGLSFTNYSEAKDSNPVNYVQIFEFPDSSMGFITQDEIRGSRVLVLEEDQLVEWAAQFEEFRNSNLRNAIHLSNGILYLNAATGLYEYDEDGLRRSPLSAYAELGNRLILPSFYDQDGILWVRAARSRNDIEIYQYEDETLNAFDTPEGTWWNGVTGIYTDRSKQVWFNNFGLGLGVIDPSSGDVRYYRQRNGLPSDFITGFMEDHEGNMWFGSRGNGLIKYSERSFIAFNFKQLLNDDVVRAIYQDSRGFLWFSTAGGGVARYDGQDYLVFSKDDYPGINNIRSITERPSGNLLFASLNGLFEYDGTRMRAVTIHRSLQGWNFSYALQDHDTLWLSSFNAGAVKLYDGRAEFFNLSNGRLQSNIVNHIFFDSKDHIWFSTNNGVAELTPRGINRYTVSNGLNNSIILQVDEDQSGRLWMASYNGGINIYDGDSFEYLTKHEGLTSNNIYSVLVDRNGNIWAGTQNGVDHILLDRTGGVQNIRNYGYQDGFTGIECNGQANYIDQENRLWFGTVNGAMRYDPAASSRNTTAPITHITEVKLFFNTIPWQHSDYDRCRSSVTQWFQLPDDLILPSDSNHISFEFEALSFEVPEKVAYQWKLEGLDKEWSPISNKTEAVYPNIPPGSYTFSVRAMNNDGIWNKQPESFSFTIKPPWWMSWWAISLFIVVFLAGIFLAVWFRIRLIEAKQIELEELVNAKTSEVTRQRDEIAKQNRQLEQQKEEILTQTEKLQNAYTNLENLSDIGKMITSRLSVAQIIDTVYDSINKLMDATVFGIGIVNEKENTIDFPGVKEKGETLEYLSFSLDDHVRLSSYCVKEKSEVFINDFEKEYRRYLPAITPAGKSGNSSSIIYLPLMKNSAVAGVITVQSFEKNAYSDFHLNILRNLAVYTRIALENASSYKQIEEQTQNLARANQDIRRQKKEIEEANKELVDLNNEKNHLIGIVAHDLRNPLTSSLSVASTLAEQQENLNEEDRESLTFIVGALKRMDKMISKILDIRAIEQKKINLNCERLNFGSVLEEVCNNLKNQAERKQIKLNTDIISSYGIADRNYLTQIFENLLSNAIKFSPADKNVWITLEEISDEIHISFIDEGPGLTEEDKSRVFRKFQRLSAMPTAGEQSTGLGLSIVKKYADVMGGRVWYDTEQEKGAKFMVAFPRVSE